MVVAGLLAGVVLVAGSFVQTRWLLGRVSPDAATADRRELRWWGGYLALAALIYVGFALRPGGQGWMPVELAGLAAYGLVGGLGATRWPALLPLGWLAHGAWDALLHRGVPTDFVPPWYPWACLSFDLVAAGVLALKVRRVASLSPPPPR